MVKTLERKFCTFSIISEHKYNFRRILKYLITLCLVLSTFTTAVYAEEVYKVAGDNNFPPYEYVDPYGIYRGFNVDILNSIGFETGMKFEFVPMEWEDAFNALENGQVDLIQGMKESEERKTKFLFTESLIMNSQSIFVRYNSWSINNAQDLAGKTVAILEQDSIYSELIKLKDIKIIEYDTIEESLDALLNNEADALIGNTLTINYLCNRKNSLECIKIVGDELNKNKYAIAVSRENGELLSILNQGLERIQENGTYELIYRKWFGAPIVSAKEQVKLYIRIFVIICLVLLGIILIINIINYRLKKIIEVKTEEQRALMEGLRKYDKMQFMDKIISSIAHEIRNPLTSIKIYAKQMKDKVGNEEFMLAAAEDIPAEIDRIDDMIKEFIEYTSPRKPVRTNINLYKNLISSMKIVTVPIRDIKISVDVDKSYYIKFDVNNFKQIVLNILLNSIDAVKYVHNPQVVIRAEEGKEAVNIQFKDNGCGMSGKDIQYIFDPFFTTKQTGNGIGMFVVRQMVEDNGGQIEAESGGEMMGMSITLILEKGEKDEE